MRIWTRASCFSFLLCMCAGSSAAQQSPFVSAETHRALAGEISGDIAYDHLRHLTLHHSPNGASRGFRDKLRWIAERARQFGLQDVRIIDDLKYRGVGWSPLQAELWIVAPDARRIASFAEAAVSIADYSRSGTWEGELMDVGAGSSDAEYAATDVKGKIVLAHGNPATVMSQAVWKRGALGVVYYNASRGLVNPDQIAWTRINPRPPKDKENTFAFSVSYRTGLELKQRIAARPAPGPVPGSFGEGTVPGEKIVLRATVEAEFDPDPKQWIVEGYIRGTRAGEPAVLLTAHGQEEKFSANDDNSGCANLLEIGRALVKLIGEGKVQRPARDIRFWWVNEFSSEYEYFSVHPEERAALLVNLNQDMVGAKQSVGSRIQHISRLPHSRPSYLETVVESVATSVMRGNSAYLSAGQAGTRAPYSVPIVSHLGTRERYGAELVPYFNSTDHHVFNHSIIGVPGMTLTNWPDDYIHSSDDDIWQKDATQLQRNAYVVAASALYLASLAPEGVPQLAVEVRAAAFRAMMAAYSRATELLSTAAPADRPSSAADGLNIIEHAGRRAQVMLDSLRAFSPDAATQAQLDAMNSGIADTESDYLQDALLANYRLLSGQGQPPVAQASEEEKSLAAKVPEVAVGVKEYLLKGENLGSHGLHSLMAFEALNFVDSRRSYLDIYRAVRAEALSAGEWYYGKVTPKSVNDLLDAAVKAGMLKLKP